MKLGCKIEEYATMADAFLAANGYTRDDVTTGVIAWQVAHGSGITKDAYALSRDVYDAHIQTALEKIFPKAVFRDAKRY